MTWEEGGQGDDEDEEGDDEEEARERREMEEEEHEEREGRPDNLTLGAEGSLCVCVCMSSSTEKHLISLSLQPASSCRVRPMWQNYCWGDMGGAGSKSESSWGHGGTWEEQVPSWDQLTEETCAELIFWVCANRHSRTSVIVLVLLRI